MTSTKQKQQHEKRTKQKIKSIKIRFVCEASTGGYYTIGEINRIKAFNREIDRLVKQQKKIINKGWKRK